MCIVVFNWRSILSHLLTKLVDRRGHWVEQLLYQKKGCWLIVQVHVHNKKAAHTYIAIGFCNAEDVNHLLFLVITGTIFILGKLQQKRIIKGFLSTRELQPFLWPLDLQLCIVFWCALKNGSSYELAFSKLNRFAWCIGGANNKQESQRFVAFFIEEIFLKKILQNPRWKSF